MQDPKPDAQYQRAHQDQYARSIHMEVVAQLTNAHEFSGGKGMVKAWPVTEICVDTEQSSAQKHGRYNHDIGDGLS